MVRFLIAALSLSAALVFPAVAQSPIKVGVFDPQRVSEETSEGKRIQTELGTLREKRLQEISAKQKVIDELQQQLTQQSLSLSADKRTTLELDLQRRLLEVNSSKDMASRELQLEVSAAEAKFNEKLRQAVQQFAQNEEFAVILESSAVAWASKSADVTTGVIDIFNRLFPNSVQQGSGGR